MSVARETRLFSSSRLAMRRAQLHKKSGLIGVRLGFNEAYWSRMPSPSDQCELWPAHFASGRPSENTVSLSQVAHPVIEVGHLGKDRLLGGEARSQVASLTTPSSRSPGAGCNGQGELPGGAPVNSPGSLSPNVGHRASDGRWVQWSKWMRPRIY